MTESNTADQDRVLGRIRKMMALANDAAASEGERENALRMVHATLAKHNLTMAMAEEAGEKEEKREAGGTVSRDQPWARHVAHSIADLYFCKYFYTKLRHIPGGKVKHNFVGRVSNVATATLMTDYVIKSIMSEANRLWKLQPDPGPWWTNFCKGAAAKIDERCRAMRAEAEKASTAASTGRELVLASFYKQEQDKNALFVQKDLGVTLRITKNKEKGIGNGFADGVNFGAKVSLNTQVGGSKGPAVRRLT